MTLHYSVYGAGEIAAGIYAYSDEVTVTVASGDPGGEEGEFAEAMRVFLAEWFDGASIGLINEPPAPGRKPVQKDASDQD
jgi:hypothetical protein